MDHDVAFSAVKRALTSPPVLAAYDPTAETVLMTDGSRKTGPEYALLQKNSENGNKSGVDPDSCPTLKADTPWSSWNREPHNGP